MFTIELYLVEWFNQVYVGMIEQKINTLLDKLTLWIENNGFVCFESNYVPRRFRTNIKSLNILLRFLYRMFPYSTLRRYTIREGEHPDTPQTLVATIKAYQVLGKGEEVMKLYKRILKLKSSQTKYFALKQGIRISIKLYEDSEEDPTPLNTVWFAQFLLDDNCLIDDTEKRALLESISKYLIEELGYKDMGREGVYFYYGSHLQTEIYNASAIMSAFLLSYGHRYGDSRAIELGNRGIKFIASRQNTDGSWFYIAPPSKSAIDSFHQAYILQAISSVKKLSSFDVSNVLLKGEEYYKTLFIDKGGRLNPLRYDSRYMPRNTWAFMKIDSRDISEAIIYYSVYQPNKNMVLSLLSYVEDMLLDTKVGGIYPDIFIYGKNRNKYTEAQGWMLYALAIARQYIS